MTNSRILKNIRSTLIESTFVSRFTFTRSHFTIGRFKTAVGPIALVMLSISYIYTRTVENTGTIVSSYDIPVGISNQPLAINFAVFEEAFR